jgi:hypothetical protein
MIENIAMIVLLIGLGVVIAVAALVVMLCISYKE